MSYTPEAGTSYEPDHLDREFRGIEVAISNLLSGDVLFTGQKAFDVGSAYAGATKTPVTLKVTSGQFLTGPQTQYGDMLAADLSDIGVFGVYAANPRLIGVYPTAITDQTETPTLSYGDPTFGMVLTAADGSGISFTADAQWVDQKNGIKFFDVGPFVPPPPPSFPTNPIVRFDNFFGPSMDPKPPLIDATTISTMTWHPADNNSFSFQLVMGTIEDYSPTKLSADPRLRIRTGAPSPTNDWNGDWLSIIVADISEIEGALPDQVDGATLQYIKDDTQPDGGRVRVQGRRYFDARLNAPFPVNGSNVPLDDWTLNRQQNLEFAITGTFRIEETDKGIYTQSINMTADRTGNPAEAFELEYYVVDTGEVIGSQTLTFASQQDETTFNATSLLFIDQDAINPDTFPVTVGLRIGLNGVTGLVINKMSWDIYRQSRLTT